MLQKIIILGTGGTIAGLMDDPSQPAQYRAGQVGIGALTHGLPGLGEEVSIESEQVAQIDSKDMNEGVWRALLARVSHHLAQPEVAGVVVAHGTDTLEETAFFLSALLPTDKPVLLTGAMRAANHPQADGPRNLADAVTLAASGQVRGVCVVFAGQVHAAARVQKWHAFQTDAFASAPDPIMGRLGADGYRGEGVSARPEGNWPTVQQVLEAAAWPRVEWLNSHALASPWLIRALMRPEPSAPPVRGLVLAGTGAGTVHAAWAEALTGCMATGVEVWISTRCAGARLLPQTLSWGQTVPWTPAQARVGLMLALLT